MPLFVGLCRSHDSLTRRRRSGASRLSTQRKLKAEQKRSAASSGAVGSWYR